MSALDVWEGEGGYAPPSHEIIERRREWNEGCHPAGPEAASERGHFAVRLVLQSECEERIVSRWSDLRWALLSADLLRAERYRPWREAGRNPAAHVFVDVIDLDDPERGSLDWDTLDG